MIRLRGFLLVSTLLIYGVSAVALAAHGINWPAVFFGDVLTLSWRAQFNVDFLIHLLLLATWIAWREGFSARGYLFGLLSIVMGGMFGFAYLLHATFAAKGDPRVLLLGTQRS